MSQQTEKPKRARDKGFYEPYAGFSRTLRAWLVAFGIGAPVLFVTQANTAAKLARSGDADCIVALFLSGVVIQVFAALLYKTTMWYLYFGEIHGEFQEKRRFTASDWLSDQYWLEFLFDASTILLFVVATWRTLVILTTASPGPG